MELWNCGNSSGNGRHNLVNDVTYSVIQFPGSGTERSDRSIIRANGESKLSHSSSLLLRHINYYFAYLLPISFRVCYRINRVRTR
jgi:hypothetical protein